MRKEAQNKGAQEGVQTKRNAECKKERKIEEVLKKKA